MVVWFIILSDVHYNKGMETKLKKFNEKVKYIEEKLGKAILVDLGDVLTNPERLYDKRGHIYIPGNHDFELLGVKFNNYKLHEEYFKTEINKDLEYLLNKNGFGTDLEPACKNYDYKIFAVEYRLSTIYFTHLRPNKRLRESLICNSNNNAVYIIYGHIHNKKKEYISRYSNCGKYVTEIRLPPFKETNSAYLFYVGKNDYILKKFLLN